MQLKTVRAALSLGVVLLLPASALAGSLPSSKAAVALGDLIALGTAAASTSGAPSSDTGWVTVMQTYIKTANQKDLSMDVALQCGLVTDTTVRSKSGAEDTSTAKAGIAVRVKVTDDAGNVSYALPNEDNDYEQGVRYCEREQTLAAKFSGLNCTADLLTGAVTCADPEELRLLLKTLNANSFNYVAPDVAPGVHKIEVQARGKAGVTLGGTKLGAASAEAFVGLGSTRIETLRLIKDAQMGPIVELD